MFLMITLQPKQNNYKYTPTFHGQRLFPVPLLKIVDKKTRFNVPAYFTKLDDKDTALMAEVCDIWERTHYGELICKNYFRKIHGYGLYNKHDYFMVEINSTRSTEAVVKAIAEVKYNDDVIELNFLQSKSELENKSSIKGAGTMLLYGLCNYAKKIKAKSIELYSNTEETDKWYAKLGFEEEMKSLFVLNRKSFNKFIKNIKEKFF